MKSHELLREVFEKCNPKQIAAELGLSVSLIYKWAEPPEESGSGTANPLDRIEALLRCTDDPRLMQWLCEKSGGFFIKNPKAGGLKPGHLVPATNQIVQEFADMLSAIAIAAADSHITKSEAKNIRARWEELKQVTEAFVQCCENGNFSVLRERVENQIRSAPNETRARGTNPA
jgi:regulatory protein CII